MNLKIFESHMIQEFDKHQDLKHASFVIDGT